MHRVFKVEYNGLARDLVTPAAVVDVVTGKRIDLSRAIWDTGATTSMLNVTTATRLGVLPTGQIEVHTANGKRPANTYLINLELPQAMVRVGSLNVSEGDLGPNIDMLIGMDVIAHGDFTVQNCAGKTHFSFCVPPLENKYDMVDKANQINTRLAKKASRR